MAKDQSSAGKTRRVVAIADLHCGHVSGLTPPEWWFGLAGGTEQRMQWAEVQRELWREYMSLVTAHRGPDLLIVNGDLIDGTGEKSGGTEHVTVDLYEQASMACRAIEEWQAQRVVITYGTRYHTAHDGQDMEKFIARQCGAEVHSHPFLNVDGVIFDVKHHTTGGQLPHTRASVLGKEWLWNVMWGLKDEQPQGHVYLRAHLHFFCAVSDSMRLAILQPALQAAMTKFGARYCRGTVDWGILTFTIQDGKLVSWEPHLVALAANRTEAIVV